MQNDQAIAWLIIVPLVGMIIWHITGVFELEAGKRHNPADDD